MNYRWHTPVLKGEFLFVFASSQKEMLFDKRDILRNYEIVHTKIYFWDKTRASLNDRDISIFKKI